MDLQSLRESSNLLVIGLFAVTTPASLLLLVTSLLRRSRRLRAPSRLSAKKLALFTTLASLSLGVAVYCNYLFLSQSYQGWLRQAYPPYQEGPSKLPLLARILHNLGIESLPEKHLNEQPKISEVVVTSQLVREWLNDSRRLTEAGIIANATPYAFWWTQQLASILPGWSLFLGWQGRRYRIPYIWAFMSLAQSISSSLAISLFFIAVILSPIKTPATVSKSPVKVRKTKVDAATDTISVEEHIALRERANYLDTSFISESPLVAWPLYLGSLAALTGMFLIPTFIGTEYLICGIALPNALLFLPTFFHTTTPENLWTTYKHLFYFILLAQAIASIAVLTATSFDGTAAPAINVLVEIWRNASVFAQDLCHAVRQSGFSLEQSTLQRFVPVYSSPVEKAIAGLDHLILSLNAYCSSLFYAVSDLILQARKNPELLLTWSKAAFAALDTAVNKLADALLAHPIVTAMGADAVLCWLSIASWIFTSSGFDDELAEESIDPVLEAQDTIDGLAGQNGAPKIPLRNSWFESHIG